MERKSHHKSHLGTAAGAHDEEDKRVLVPVTTSPQRGVLQLLWARTHALVLSRVLRLPLAQFYWYLFQKNKRLFFASMFVNYGLPAVLEMMPWYLSQSSLSRELRDSRNRIEHALIGGRGLGAASIWGYLGLSVMYSFVHTANLMLSNRVDLAVRLMVKRMIMERILYSEVGSLQLQYRKYMCLDTHSEVRTEEIEAQLFSDISMTMHLFNFIVPTVIRGSIAFYRQAKDLYGDRHRIDIVAVLRPTLVSIIIEVCNELRIRYIDDEQYVEQMRTSSENSRVVSNIVDGLAEVQVNNMQAVQLQQLDAVAQREVHNKEGWYTFVDRMYRSIRNRNVLDFVSEMYVVQYVMAKHNMDHETYRKVQNDIDHVFRLLQRLYGHARQGLSVWENQGVVMSLLNLPSFVNEEALVRRQADVDPLTFRELCVYHASFRFHATSPPVLRLCSQRHQDALCRAEQQQQQQPHESPSRPIESPIVPMMRFQRGKVYCLLGQNQSGKSTLVKLLCRLHVTHTLPSESLAERDTQRSSATSLCDLECRCECALDAASCIDSDTGDCTAASHALTHPPDEVMGFGRSVITLDGQDLRCIPRSRFRSVISYVAQRPFIFPGTIEDNIRVGCPQASSEGVLMAAHLAGVDLSVDHHRLVESRVQAGAGGTTGQGLSLDERKVMTQDDEDDEEDEHASSLDVQQRRRRGQQLHASPTKPWERSHLKTAWHWLCRSMPLHARQALSDWMPLSGPVEQGEQGHTAKDCGADAVEMKKEEATVRDGEECDEQMSRQRVWARTVGVRLAGVRHSDSQEATVCLSDDNEETLQRAERWRDMHCVAAPPPPPPPQQQRVQEHEQESHAAGTHNNAEEESPLTMPSALERARLQAFLHMQTDSGGSNLSGGLAQSVALARVFLRKDARLIILDEAMGHMDMIKKREFIIPRLLYFARQHQITMILISHDVSTVGRLCDYAYVLRHGILVHEGTHEQLVESKAEEYMRLLGAVE